MTQMTAAHFYQLILQPAAITLSSVHPELDSPEARCLMLAFAGQESEWTSRIQVPNGQARGFWQCEIGGVVSGVMRNGGMCAILAKIGAIYSINVRDPAGVWEAIAWHDPLAYTVARLALWMDPYMLPPIGDIDSSYETYLRVWRPGKPSRDRWNLIYPQTVAIFQNS